MNKKWKIVTTLGILAITCGVYTWGIPAAVNIKARKHFIEQKVFETSGYRIDIGNPKLSMGFFPSVWIASDNISILNSDNSKALSIDNPKLKIKLFPLLFKKVEFAKVSADKEEAYFVLTKDSKFLLGEYPLKSDKKSAFTLHKMDLNLGKYDIYLDDRLNSQKVSLRGEYFNNGQYIQNKHVNFATEGVFNVGNESAKYFADVAVELPINSFTEDKLKIIASVDNFDLASISDYVAILTKGKIKKLAGAVNFSADTKTDKFSHKNIFTTLTTENLEIIGHDRAASVVYKDKITAKINFDTVENGINFKDSSVTSDKIHAYLEGKIFNIGEKFPNLNLTAEVRNTRLEDVVAILPWSEKILPDFNLYKLKKYVFYGNGEGKVNFKGRCNRPHVNGSVKLRDAYLIHPIKGAPANASIDLDFMGQIMKLNVFVPAGKNQNVSVKGNIKIDGSKYSELEIKSTDAVDMAPAQEILVPLHEIFKFQLGPVPMMKIQGLGKINMHSAGRKVDPHIWGEIKFRNVTASFNDIKHLVLKNGSGEVIFNDTKTTFKSYYATINDKLVEIKGDCSVLGKLNVYVTSKGQRIPLLIKTINSSPILIDVQKVVAPFTKPDGIADVYLNIYGTAKNAEEVVFNEDIFSRGTITFHNATTVMQDTYLPFKNINGVVNFDQYNSDYNVNGYVRNSRVYVKGTGNQSQIDLVAKSDRFSLEDCNHLLYPDLDLPYKDEAGKIDASFVGYYKGDVNGNQIDYNKVKVDGKFLPNRNSSNPIKIDGGSFTIRNSVMKTSTLTGLFHNNPYKLSFTVSDIYNSMVISDAVFDFKNFDVATVNDIKNQLKLPKEVKSLLEDITDIKGLVDIKGNIKNGHIWANTNLKDTSFVYKPFGAVVRVMNGDANVRGNTLYLSRINSRVSAMPVFVDGSISNIYSALPNLNLFVSAKPTQHFFDRFFNSKSVYPVKLKGDVNFNTQLKGPLNRISAKSNLNIGEDSSIYYMGATLAGAPTGTIGTDGISTNPVSIISDVVLYPNKLKINSMHYNQTITSQNKKKSVQNQVNMSGEISLLKNNVLGFKNLKIVTAQPTDAKIFNILLKKPTIKQGVFTSNLLINGTSLAPYILGDLNIKSIDIPLLDATIRDINIDCQKDFIKVDSKGVVLTNDIVMNAKIVNKPNPPIVIEEANVQMDELNLNIVSNALNDFEADNTRNKTMSSSDVPITPEQFIIKNASVNADTILIKKATATNFKSNITLGNDHVLNVDNYSFNLANGTVDGSINYNLTNYNGNAQMNIKDADAQIISENFFDMPGQMYGLVTGDLRVACTGTSSVDCVNTLSGAGNFQVIDGKMPKLGSLEYLLKAGNLITGGITGLSINGIIDLITPLKTGNFESISGDVKVKDGIATDINIYSKGKDLNMYLTGSYNISSLIADMEIYGSLSKNFSTLLGKIGNSSLNRLFNTIPGVKINEINPNSTSNINKIPNFDKTNVLRVFKAEIYGDINGSNYVKSFRWIKD